MVKSFVTAILILLAVALCESAILSNISFLPAVPDLLLICAIYFSIINGRTYGVVLGFFSGLILDYVSGCPFGLNCLLRTLLGYSAGFLSGTINYRGIVIPMMIGLVGSVVKVFFTWIISLFYPNYVLNYSVFSFIFLTELILNVIFTPVIFKLLGCFNKSICFNYGEID